MCGINVDKATALHAEHDDQAFYFYSDQCRQKLLSMPVTAKSEAKSQGTSIYTCPMHPEIEQEHFSDCPKQ